MTLREAVGLAAVALLAAVLRIWPVVASPETQRGGLGQFGDSFGYHRIAANLLRGHGFSATYDGAAFGQPVVTVERYEPAATRPPLYPAFLALTYRFVGAREDASAATWRTRWDAARFAQGILDATVCVLLFLLVRVMAPDARVAPHVAALAYALNPYAIFWSRALLVETLSVFLTTISVLAYTFAVTKDTRRAWLAAGAAVGLAALCAGQVLLFPLFLGAWWVARRWRGSGRSRAIRHAVLGVAGLALALAPWAARNAIVVHRFMPIAVSATGWRLLVGSYVTKESWSGWGMVPASRFPEPSQRNAVVALQDSLNQLLQSGDPRLADTDRRAMRFALQQMREYPGGTLHAWLEGIPRLWYQRQIHWYRDREPSGIWAMLILLAAGVAWFLAPHEQRRRMEPALLLAGYLTLLFIPMHVEPRYSIVAMPGLIAVGSTAVERALSWTRARRRLATVT